MTIDEQSREAFADITTEDLASVLFQLGDHICVHRPILDEFETVVDGELVWWNQSYQEIRRYEVEAGQRISTEYIDPDVAIAHLSTAWQSGKSLQILEITPRLTGRFRYEGNEDGTWVQWQRIGNLVIEVSSEVSEVLALRKMIGDQKSLLAIAYRKRAMAVERERIARNLHDTVIQNLYATSLSLSIAGRRAHREVGRAINVAIDSLADVISEIRREILDVETRRASPLRLLLEDALIPILLPSNTRLDLRIDSPDLNDEITRHVRAVCVEGTSNAVRHGHASLVAISIEMTDHHLIITISDDGTGIPENVTLHNGLHNMRERAESLGGNMEITSETSRGTTVTWSIPNTGWSK
jgi:signal transduction histidine kinase